MALEKYKKFTKYCLKPSHLGNIINRKEKFEKKINILAAYQVDKGKLPERVGRKAMGLKHQKC
jgi:hypothetical protein